MKHGDMLRFCDEVSLRYLHERNEEVPVHKTIGKRTQERVHEVGSVDHFWSDDVDILKHIDHVHLCTVLTTDVQESFNSVDRRIRFHVHV